ncbi:MAG: type II toxin-antitoxin system VapC family toxin [Proteobacteria bacterium]|nr:type II toxin-antitoxin system VapC family toxin [Pseudomonadota bacterium]
MRYILDTNLCIEIMKRRPAAIQARLIDLSTEEVAISSIVAAELWYGVAYSQKKKQNETALRDFLNYVTVLDWPQEASHLYGQIRAGLKEKGTPIGAMDLLIAAHALFLDAILVTDNTRELRRVPGLKVENWLDGK